jgi:hypothetical protein
MLTMPKPSALHIAALALALAALPACEDDSKDSSPRGDKDSGTETPDDGGTGDQDGGTPEASALYAVVTVPATSMGAPTTSYVILSDKLTGELKTEDAVLEVPGTALAAGPVGGKRLFIATSENGLVKRYDLTDDNKLKAAGEVNFEAKQIQSFSGYASNFQFVDETKAYYLAHTAAKLLIWDPEELVITGEVALPQLVREDPANPGTNFVPSVTGAPLRVGDKIYFFTAWDSRAAGTIKVEPAATVVVIDTKTDQAKVVVDEGTCGYTRDGVVSGDWIYLATEAAGTAVNYLNDANGAAPCMRRFNLKTEAFDADYKPDLNAIAGAPAGSLVATPSGGALIYVLDTAAADPMIGTGAGQINNPRALAVAALWKTARLSVGDTPSVEVLDLPLTSGTVLPIPLQGDLHVTATFDDKPELREVTDDGVIATDRANAKLGGATRSIVQLR